MRKKGILEAMKQGVTTTLEGAPNDLLAISAEQTTDKETGEMKNFIKVEAEIPKGNGELSRCRFTAKIPDGRLKVTEEQLADEDYEITFKDLEISYIDNNGNVYFRAADYSVKKVEV